MIKADLVSLVADKTGINKGKAEDAIDALLLAMKQAIVRGERIELRGFGIFAPKPRKVGVGRNPRTGELTPIQPGRTVRFKPGKELNEAATLPTTAKRAGKGRVR